LAEAVDPESGEQRGNYPQAYSHIGLLNSALSLADSNGSSDVGSSAAASPAPLGRNESQRSDRPRNERHRENPTEDLSRRDRRTHRTARATWVPAFAASPAPLGRNESIEDVGDGNGDPRGTNGDDTDDRR